MLLLLSCFSHVDSVRPQRQQPTRLPCPWDSPGKNTGVACHSMDTIKMVAQLRKTPTYASGFQLLCSVLGLFIMEHNSNATA